MTDEIIDDASFNRVMTLAYAFEENKKQDSPKVSWGKMKRELEPLTVTELEMLLGLLKTKG